MAASEQQEQGNSTEKKQKSKKERKKSLRTRFILINLVMFILIDIWSAVLFARITARTAKTSYTDKALSCAWSVSRLLNGDDVARYAATMEKDEAYEVYLQKLTDFKNAFDLQYLYICVPEEDGYRYIWDAGDPDSEEGIMDLGDFDEYYGEGAVFMKAAFAEDFSQDIGTNNSFEHNMLVTSHPVYGFVASAFIPVFDSAGNAVALAAVDVSMEGIFLEVVHALVIFVISMVLIVIVFSWFYFRLMSQKIIRPIKKLDDMAENFVANQMQKGEVLKCDIRTGDEIESLGNAFEHMSQQLKEYMDNFTAVTKEKERIGAELDVARKIQADMLPRIFPLYPERSDFDIYASMSPAKEVGGDFYDIFLIDQDHIALVIADVSGKGVPAALFMAISKSLIQNRTMLGGTPDIILQDVNEQLCQGNDAQYFVTVWFAILDLNTGDGFAVNGGHEHPVVKRKDGAFEYVKYKHSAPMGVMEGIPFPMHPFHLDRGDSLFVYTDGVPEATNAKEELYGEERLIEALNDFRGSTQKDLLAHVRRSVDAFVGDAPQFDDLTMLGFRLNEIG
ncbi:MAG: SpoIIE family protein phosphatase [Lachnospiraceae bacterium]|nr:SpoIIE family protein phosphatase [Lachnospiraceae bacterium]